MDRRWVPMNKNRIEGIAEQGERANGREALVTKVGWRRSGGVQRRSAFLPGEISPCA